MDFNKYNLEFSFSKLKISLPNYLPITGVRMIG